MTLYRYGALPAVTAAGELLTGGGSGQVFAVADTTFATPLTVLLEGNVSASTVEVSTIGLTPPFSVEDHAEVVFKSGPDVVRLASLGGLVERAEAAAAAAAASRAAAEGVAATVENAPAILPPGGSYGDMLVRGAAEHTGEWAPAPTGGGGGGALPADYPSSWPSQFPPTAHSHTVSAITDATSVGRSLMTAADAQAARAAIGAGTGNGTSNLTLGTTSSTAAPGNHVHDAGSVTYTPSGGITATNVQAAIAQAATLGGGGTATATSIDVVYASGAYPTQPATPPAGAKVRRFLGPVPYAGPAWAGVVDVYNYAPLT